ncbi:p-loop containing nucleoside triphosphate hydrolase [Pleurostoma richardsiae]|uniref:P-loop containing nucleoside triphosphate hydrolase n=1 Tax=Pleurostoma richardsiae TaxID=41990 RepID=A0AA38RQU9_9PEZI|nr:p-loop containing nucleoside triphosphate hydrolase [Pleurostoma richardsiae]
MRPLPGDDAVMGRPRASDNDTTPSAFQHPASSQMTYFLADEAAIDASAELTPSTPLLRARDCRKPNPHDPAESGVGLSPHAGPGDKDVGQKVPSSHHQQHYDVEKAAGDGDSSSVSESSPRSKSSGAESSTAHAAAAALLSQPMTPIMLGTSGPASSALSSASSRRNSFVGSLSEEVGSQALSFSEEAEREQALSSMMDSGSAPQLIMPSIKMPSRRPFTDEGKRMGRLKVLVAGDSGVGKTSLIKAIVQSCEHIVHVDPIGPSQSSLASSRASLRHKRGRPSKGENSTNQITEIHASTKPYPEWWSDLDDFRVLKRRKSLGDTVLDRNVCFVDTPGYGYGSSSMDTITPVVRYVESHFERVQSNATGEAELLNMLGGDGGSQVDVVFYIVHKKLKPVDLQYLRMLAPLTNVIPLLAQADTMSPEEVSQRKDRISCELHEAKIRPFTFSTSSAGFNGAGSLPYAISSAPGSDHETMDASLLMSPDYVQPLIPTELSALVERVFCENGASWLRHSAARKYLQWRSSDNPSRPRALYRPLSLPNNGHMSITAQAPVLTPPMGATSSYALARIADHTQREERLAQIRLANWASELQRSLANERARYEALARSERAIWLTEKLNDCVLDGTLVAVEPLDSTRDRSVSRIREKIRRKLAGERDPSGGVGPMRHHDPLGLLEVAADLKAKGWVALEVVGSLGVLGGLALWMAKHYWHIQAYEWVIGEWYKFWYGER